MCDRVFLVLEIVRSRFGGLSWSAITFIGVCGMAIIFVGFVGKCDRVLVFWLGVLLRLWELWGLRSRLLVLWESAIAFTGVLGLVRSHLLGLIGECDRLC
jgi:hypothetical protein